MEEKQTFLYQKLYQLHGLHCHLSPRKVKIVRVLTTVVVMRSKGDH